MNENVGYEELIRMFLREAETLRQELKVLMLHSVVCSQNWETILPVARVADIVDQCAAIAVRYVVEGMIEDENLRRQGMAEEVGQ